MVEDAGFVIEQQRLQKEKSTLNKSVADMPYTGNPHQLPSPVDPERLKILEYLTLAELDQWLEFVTEEFPDVTYLKQIGTTVEDRPIMGFHLGDKNDNSDKKKIYMGNFI